MNEDWCQKYQPQEEKDVLISKTCYTQIKAFFSNHFGPKLVFQRNEPQHSILFLFGPSGSGKRSTVDYLSTEFEVALATPDQLQIDDNNESLKERDNEPDYIKDLFKMFSVATSWKKVVFVMSNVLEISNVNRKRQFESLVNSYLSHQHKIPIIFILNSNLFNEPKVKRAFPEELFRSQASIVKRLKPYSDACIKKALTKIFDKEPILQRCDSTSLKEEIVLKCNGDLKQALNQLYLISLSIKNGSMKNTRSYKKVKSVTSTQQSQRGTLMHSDSNQSDTSQVTRFKDREFSLFHTLGKFLYNKRLDPKTNQSRIMSSTELMQLQPKFYFEPAHLLNQLCVDLSLFVLFLHENYLDFYGEIEDVVNMSEAFEDSDIFHTFNFRQERNELQNYQNEMLNTLITSTGLMVHNVTGGDRLNEEKNTDKGTKRFKPLSKPRLLSIKNETNTNRAHIKSLTKDWMVPFNCIVEDYPYDFKFEQRDERQSKFIEKKNTGGMYGSRPGTLDEEDLLIDCGNGDDTNNTTSGFTQFAIEQRHEYGKRPYPEAFIEDDIEDVE